MKMTDGAIDVLLGRVKLMEADEEEGDDEEEPKGPDFDDTIPERADETDKPTDQIPLEDDIDEPEEQEVEVLGEGQIPQDSSGVTEGEFGALSPHGVVDVQFEQGNWNGIFDMGQVVSDKVDMITKTLEPLCEKAMIELLGSSSMYKRLSAEVTSGSDESGGISFTGVFRYQCSFWIGIDVKREDVEADAKYVMNTLLPINESVKISECSIDTATGILTVGFTL